MYQLIFMGLQLKFFKEFSAEFCVGFWANGWWGRVDMYICHKWWGLKG